MREKVGKSRNTVFFQWFGAPEGRKVGSLKRRVRSQLARWEMKSCTPLWREADFQVKMYKTHHSPDRFWKLRCQKSARRCGAKHISKSKCTKHTQCPDHFWKLRMSKKCTPLWREAHFQVKQNVQKHAILGPLLEVQMSKKCTPLWREAHFQVKMYKTPHVRATFGGSDVEKVHTVVTRSTLRSQNVQNTTCSHHFWRFGCRKSARRCRAKHISKSKCTKHHMFAPLLEVRMSKKYTPLWREAHLEVKMYKTHQGFGPLLEVRMSLRFNTLHYRTLRYSTLQYTTLHYIALQYTPLH